MLRIQSKPIRTVLTWQLVATAAIAALAGYLAGVHGVVSAALGGAVSVAAGLVFVLVTSLGKAQSVEGTLVRALRAEAAKIGTVVVLLWVVLATYTNVVAVALIGTFAVTVVIFSMAFFVRDV